MSDLVAEIGGHLSPEPNTSRIASISFWSPTGVEGSFRAMRTETPSAFLGATPTHVGLFANVDSDAHVVHCYCDVFLKVA